jgi:predicted RNA-binding Zn-ribbon protein involved in translation (DUF1610 family)
MPPVQLHCPACKKDIDHLIENTYAIEKKSIVINTDSSKTISKKEMDISAISDFGCPECGISTDVASLFFTEELLSCNHEQTKSEVNPKTDIMEERCRICGKFLGQL